MSLYSSMYIGVTGLNANSQQLSVTGDNIANANTIGFKAGRTAFADILGAQTSNGQMGLGTRLQAVQKILTQGALTTTGMATDLAIQGNGFFTVDGPDGRFYTRAGQFTIDQDGYLVNLDNLKVQGYQADANGVVGSSLSDMMVGNASTTPVATTNITLRGNLDANTFDPTAPPLAAYDPNDPTTYHFGTGTVIYDSLGNAHNAEIHYIATGVPNEWTYAVVTDDANVTGTNPGDLEVIESGTLTFDNTGAFVSQAGAATGGFNPINAIPTQTIGIDLSGLTQFGANSGMSFVGQDGYGSGELAGIQIDAEGIVTGAFTNGESRALGQVAIADFSAADQLQKVGGNLFRETRMSGEANIGTAKTGGRGAIMAGTLEQSNVDLAGEFVNMIVAQRGFQANSKTIQTADTLLGELMQLKR